MSSQEVKVKHKKKNTIKITYNKLRMEKINKWPQIMEMTLIKHCKKCKIKSRTKMIANDINFSVK